ncbi:MAG: hypothetical protein RL447_825 [Bacteroidota bacterium]|jgi:hypothetical protein
MKKGLYLFVAVSTLLLIVIGCQKSVDRNEAPNDPFQVAVREVIESGVTSNPACSGPFAITLESVTANINNTYTWTWSVMNPNPGNGLNGTVQGLSHWNIKLGACIVMDDLIGAAMSSDGTNWTAFTPTYAQDPSILNVCNIATGPVLKFELGTNGTAKSWFKIVISKNVDVDMNGVAFFKSGNRTGCGQICFPGFGCPIVINEGCSWSQGYWFNSQNRVWPDVNGSNPGVLTLGGKHYTQAEGMAIWNTSNARGLSDAKKAFCQAASILLSGNNVQPAATIWTDVNVINTWLSTKPKLSADGSGGTMKVQPKSVDNTNIAAGIAGGNIGSWIAANHCQ